MPLRALSVGFRGRFLQRLRRVLPDVKVPPTVWTTPWVVYAKPTVQGADRVLRYLARYVHRAAITDARIVCVTATTVTFRYQDAQARAWRTMTLAGEEFLRRFLQHVLPHGFHKVRYYGWWRPQAVAVRARLQQQLTPPAATPDHDPPSAPDVIAHPRCCPQCGTGHLLRTRRLLRAPALARPP